MAVVCDKIFLSTTVCDVQVHYYVVPAGRPLSPPEHERHNIIVIAIKVSTFFMHEEVLREKCFVDDTLMSVHHKSV